MILNADDWTQGFDYGIPVSPEVAYARWLQGVDLDQTPKVGAILEPPTELRHHGAPNESPMSTPGGATVSRAE
jgi:hypothetical protein